MALDNRRWRRCVSLGRVFPRDRTERLEFGPALICSPLKFVLYRARQRCTLSNVSERALANRLLIVRAQCKWRQRFGLADKRWFV